MENKLVIYGIGGLGADHRVFKYMTLDFELRPITWIKSAKDEDLPAYARRISHQIDEKIRFGLIGVSFGGMLAVELNRIVKPHFTILISSASKSSDLPRVRLFIKNLNILKYLPSRFLKPPLIVMKYLFGAHNSRLLKEIIKDTNSEFLRWAIGEITDWNFEEETENLHRIHGSNDRLIPLRNKVSHIIEEGGHFMIVDLASQVSEVVNSISSQYQDLL